MSLFAPRVSKLGAWVLTPTKARKFADDAPPPSAEPVSLIILQDNSTGFPSSDNYSSVFRVDGDITSRYPSAASSYTVTFGSLAPTAATGIASTSSAFGRDAGCGGTHTGTYTNFLLNFIAGAAGDPGDPIDVLVHQGATVIDYWPAVPQCAVVVPGLPDFTQYHYRDPSSA